MIFSSDTSMEVEDGEISTGDKSSATDKVRTAVSCICVVQKRS